MERELLDCIQLPIPAGYENGQITSYSYKSIAMILMDEDLAETQILKEWLQENLFQIIEWPQDLRQLDESVILRALDLFNQFKIKPTGCRYMDTETQGETDDFDECA